MKTETKTTKRIVVQTEAEPRSGGIRIDFEAECSPDSHRFNMPALVTVELCGEEGDVDRILISPADIERAAKMLEKAREAEMSDFRCVCVEHGYCGGRCGACFAADEAEPKAE